MLLLLMLLLILMMQLLLRHLQVQFEHRVRGWPPHPEGNAGQRQPLPNGRCIQGPRHLPVDALEHVASLGEGGQCEAFGTRRFRRCVLARRQRCAERRWSDRCRDQSLLQREFHVLGKNKGWGPPVMCCDCLDAEAGDDGMSRVMTTDCSGSATPPT
jgi:hypothetical protein